VNRPGILFILTAPLAAAACASRGESDVAEAIRAMQQATTANSAAPDPVRMSRRDQLRVDVARKKVLLQTASESGDAQATAAASAALDRAEKELQREEERLQQLEDLKARTPRRIIDPTVAFAGASTGAGPASRPASRPATVEAPATSPADVQFRDLTERIRWLADLRNSTGDHAGSARLRERMSVWVQEYKSGNRDRAIAELKKVAAQADR
jgi:hypothetical protein